MSDAGKSLQGAIYVRLRSQVTAVAQRVYDYVPQQAVFPYIGFGEFQTVDDGAECVDGVEVFVTLHVWSRAVGRVECHEIAGAVRAALHGWTPDLSGDGLDCVEMMHRDTRVMSDPDGLTTHGILTFRALIDAL